LMTRPVAAWADQAAASQPNNANQINDRRMNDQ
jgi:hypothetical protein